MSFVWPVAEAKRAVGWRDASLARNADNTLSIFCKGLSLNPSNRTNGGQALLFYFPGQCAPNIGGVTSCGREGARCRNFKAKRNCFPHSSMSTSWCAMPEFQGKAQHIEAHVLPVLGCAMPEFQSKAQVGVCNYGTLIQHKQSWRIAGRAARQRRLPREWGWPVSIYKTIDKLTKRQQDVLGMIAINMDWGHHPKTIAVLLKKELIVETEQRLGGRFPVTIKRYAVPIHVHMAWCQWCSDHITQEGIDAMEKQGGGE